MDELRRRLIDRHHKASADQCLEKGKAFLKQGLNGEAYGCFLHGITFVPRHGELLYQIACAHWEFDPSDEASSGSWGSYTLQFSDMVWWLLRSARAGFIEAQYEVGLLLHENEGWGVEQDLPASHSWLRQAATQGHGRAAYELSKRYEMGIAVPIDMKEADRWFRKALDFDCSEAKSKVQLFIYQTRMRQCAEAVEAGDADAAAYHDFVDAHCFEFFITWSPGQFSEEWMDRYKNRYPQRVWWKPAWWEVMLPDSWVGTKHDDSA